MNRFIAGMTAALLAVILVFSVPAKAVSARSAIVMDAAAGRVLFQRLPDEKSLIASTTKIMTALIVCEQCNVLDRMRIPKEAVGVEGSSIYLKEGEILTIQELLYGMMLHSGNDAATALAIYCGGTVEGFAQLMNDKARQLGLRNTHFENPHGLDGAEHYSSAEDLAKLAIYAMNNPIFARTVSTKNIRVGERVLRNHNKLLWRLDGADGVKTGFTKAAGRILVSSASRDGRRIVVVTISAPDDWNDHIMLHENAFSKFSLQQIIEKDQILGTVQIAGGNASSVEIIADEPFAYPIASDESITLKLPEPGFVYAPISEGQPAGKAQIYLDGNNVGSISLVYGKTVEMSIEPKEGFLKRLFGGSGK